MTRTPSDACFFVGMMAATVAAGAWLYNQPTWFTAALIITVIATVAWAITRRHENRPVPYTTTVRYDIDQLFRQQRGEWEQRGTTTWTYHKDDPFWPTDNQPTMTPHQADTNWPDDHLPVWPNELGSIE